jgi:hypothetical protein
VLQVITSTIQSVWPAIQPVKFAIISMDANTAMLAIIFSKIIVVLLATLAQKKVNVPPPELALLPALLSLLQQFLLQTAS